MADARVVHAADGATVDGERRRGDERRVVAREERYGVCDLLAPDAAWEGAGGADPGTCGAAAVIAQPHGSVRSMTTRPSEVRREAPNALRRETAPRLPSVMWVMTRRAGRGRCAASSSAKTLPSPLP